MIITNFAVGKFTGPRLTASWFVGELSAYLSHQYSAFSWLICLLWGKHTRTVSLNANLHLLPVWYLPKNSYALVFKLLGAQGAPITFVLPHAHPLTF